MGTYLLGLVRKDLVRPDASTFAQEETYRFRHLLIRDAAYQAMPKQTRAELHERFAGWLERMAGERLVEYEEILGYHLEQAARYVRDLGGTEDRGEHLARAAAGVLGGAGVRASKRGDYAAAASLLERALSLRPEDPESVEWLTRLGRAQHNLGQMGSAKSTLERGVALARSFDDEVLVWKARLAYSFFLLFADPRWSAEDARELADAAIPVLERAGDDHGLALAWRLLGDAASFTGQIGEWGRANERAIEHARRAEDWGHLDAALGDVEQALVYGPTPVSEALDRCRRILEEDEGSIQSRIWTKGIMALLEARRGRLGASRALLAEARAAMEELGQFTNEWLLDEAAGGIELLAGDPGRAANAFGKVLDYVRETGDLGLLLAWNLVHLGKSLCLQGKFEEAEGYARQAVDLATTDTTVTLMQQSILARVLAHRGELVQAERLARESVQLAETTDAIEQQADALMDMAEVLVLAGRAHEAATAARDALERYERKGTLVLADRTRSLLKAIQGQ